MMTPITHELVGWILLGTEYLTEKVMEATMPGLCGSDLFINDKDVGSRTYP